ncbi:hypothetical protein CPB84DRAFT_1853931 [Gymnopilus junonius]|uniref:Uncharacterized protein n=1 Tax=Gymnopilus junonius TaxID=109634 RepID=A0A9P5NAA1_GYMJU|nr:hypothetical protein CPB84DRAFT_1853931 [Gymnopilus junonius]
MLLVAQTILRVQWHFKCRGQTLWHDAAHPLLRRRRNGEDHPHRERPKPRYGLMVAKAIGALPSLVSLTLDFTESTIVLTLEKDIGLKDLKSLTVTAPLPFTRSFLPKISTTALESLGAMCPSQPPSNKKEFLEEVVERWGETLHRVELVHQQVQVDAGGAGGHCGHGATKRGCTGTASAFEEADVSKAGGMRT